MANKYHNTKTTYDGYLFDSRKEALRYADLKAREEEGEIQNLRRQVKFTLIPVQREPDEIGPRGGIKKGKLIERACCYNADFVYEENGKTVVEDVKSPATRTKSYIIKRKLMLFIHGIRVREV